MSRRELVVAAVQASPVFLDREATVEKACRLIAEAAAKGASLIVLPETFVPAYPAWVWTLPLTRRADVSALYRALVENAVDVPGPVVERLGAAARAANAWVSIGINERNATRSGTTLYNTNLLFSPDGELRERHRKLMPTGAERLVWTPGEAVPLRVHDTSLGRVSVLTCWENYMPLARYALYELGAQIHLAPTWDKSEQWLASMRHIAREGRVYVVSVCQCLHRDEVPDAFPFKDTFPAASPWFNTGNSVVIDPDGVVLAGPLAEREETLYVTLDAGRTSGSRWIFDAAGHYDRPDLFTFAMRPAPAAPEPPPARGPARKKAAKAPRGKAKASAPRSRSRASGRNRGGSPPR